jgi:hypothetical protein
MYCILFCPEDRSINVIEHMEDFHFRTKPRIKDKYIGETLIFKIYTEEVLYQCDRNFICQVIRKRCNLLKIKDHSKLLEKLLEKLSKKYEKFSGKINGIIQIDNFGNVRKEVIHV